MAGVAKGQATASVIAARDAKREKRGEGYIGPRPCAVCDILRPFFAIHAAHTHCPFTATVVVLVSVPYMPYPKDIESQDIEAID